MSAPTLLPPDFDGMSAAECADLVEAMYSQDAASFAVDMLSNANDNRFLLSSVASPEDTLGRRSFVFGVHRTETGVCLGTATFVVNGHAWIFQWRDEAQDQRLRWRFVYDPRTELNRKHRGMVGQAAGLCTEEEKEKEEKEEEGYETQQDDEY